MAIEEPSSQEKTDSIALPSIHQASSTNTEKFPSKHNDTTIHDICEPVSKKPKVDWEN